MNKRTSLVIAGLTLFSLGAAHSISAHEPNGPLDEEKTPSLERLHQRMHARYQRDNSESERSKLTPEERQQRRDQRAEHRQEMKQEHRAAWAEFLDMSPEELTARLEENLRPHQVAEELGKTSEEIRDFMSELHAQKMVRFEARLSKAVEAGELTSDAADQIRSTHHSWWERLQTRLPM